MRILIVIAVFAVVSCTPAAAQGAAQKCWIGGQRTIAVYYPAMPGHIEKGVCVADK